MGLRISTRFVQLSTFSVALLLMASPWFARVLGHEPTSVENRRLAEFPKLSFETIGDASTFSDLSEYIKDRTPLRGHAAEVLGELALATNLSTNAGVFFGPQDHILLAEDMENSCAVGFEWGRLSEVFAQWDAAAGASGKQWMFTVAPDKGAVLEELLSGRAAKAMECGSKARATFRSELAAASASPLDLWAVYDSLSPDERIDAYYANDSHWTFEASGLAAEALVGRYLPKAWSEEHIGPSGRSLTVTADVAARLGVDRSLVVDALGSKRPGITTQLVEADVGGTRAVRTYRSSGIGPLVPGRTLILHDSMMNFMELQVAPYFEHVDFIHWNDLNRASFIARAASADRVIIEVVERNMYTRLGSTLLAEPFVSDFAASLRGDSVSDPDLAGQLVEAIEAARAYEADTGELLEDFGELLTSNVPGWRGPYLAGPSFETGSHPKYGEWRTITRVDRALENSLQRCDGDDMSCGTWVLLLGVPRAVVEQLDVELDDGDGLGRGSLRLSLPNEIVYAYAGN